MANPEHVEILKQGVEVWNKWREGNPNAQLDLSNTDFRDLHIYDFQGINLSGVDLTKTIIGGNFEGANFSSAVLRGAEFSVAYLDNADLSNTDLKDSFFEGTIFEGVNLSRADLRNATIIESSISGDVIDYVNFSEVNLSRANLSKMDLHGFDFSKANLSRANLKGADLTWANLSEANLHAAKLNRATISWANLSEADLSRADLTGCKIYAISAWNIRLDNTIQKNLIITRDDEITVTVDDLEVAQFIYLLLHNEKIRHVIDTITSKVVLILGRFIGERKMVLDALKDKLSSNNYSPVVFNFEEHSSENFIDAVRTLANMAHFVLIDLTDLDNVVQKELATSIIPRCVVPIQPLLLGNRRYDQAIFRDPQQKCSWFLPLQRYKDTSGLLASFQEKIIQFAEEKTTELKQRKPLKLFFGYAPEDKEMLDTLKKHLKPLERSGLIEMWDDGAIKPGGNVNEEREKHLADARITLLLMSSDFIASNDCYTLQEKAMEGNTKVIPILLRSCAWKSTPLGQLQVLPRDERPIEKQNLDDIFLEVVGEISDVIKEMM